MVDLSELWGGLSCKHLLYLVFVLKKIGIIIEVHCKVIFEWGSTVIVLVSFNWVNLDMHALQTDSEHNHTPPTMS